MEPLAKLIAHASVSDPDPVNLILKSTTGDEERQNMNRRSGGSEHMLRRNNSLDTYCGGNEMWFITLFFRLLSEFSQGG